LVSRHEILRTKVVTIDGVGYQEILDESIGFPLSFKDLTKSKDEDLDSLILHEVSRPFESDKPLCRGLCLKLSEQERALAITFHHMISDGWSVGIFNKEFSAAYESFAGFTSPDLPTLPVQYVDYGMWQRSWLSGNVLEKQLSYWQEQLHDVTTLELPTDRDRPSVQSYRGGYYRHYISKEKLEKLRQLSKDEGVTLFMVLFSIFSGVLSKLSHQNDIVIGTPIAGRNSSDVEGLIGFFVNTLALRVDTGGNPKFKELLHRAEKATLGAYEHQDVPFEQLVDHLNIPRNLSIHPLFQVMFALQNMETTDISMGNLDLKYEYNDEERRAKFDLTLTAEESPEGLCFGFEYAKDLFDEQSIVKLARYYDQFLTAIITDAEQRLSEISILDSKELAQLVSFNSTDVSYPQNKTIHQLFEDQVERDPDSIALIYENKQLSYDGLNKRSNQLSHLLRKEGVTLDSLVGISVPRGLEFVIGMLAILKAGGAYVPLDLKYPEDRLNYMLEDAGIDVLLTVRGLGHLYQNYKGKIIYLDDHSYLTEPTANIAITVPFEALAYVIYTSGSTGRPKGVGVTQGSILNHMQWMIDNYFDHFMPHILQRTNPNFDASVWELLLPLVMKGKMVVTADEKLQNPQEIIKIADRCHVNTIQLVPALVDMFEQENCFKNLKLRKVFVGGDKLTHKHLNTLKRANTECLVYNLYGPTESTIDASSFQASDLFEEMPIGVPISNTQIHILDDNLNQVPIGAIGEIFIGGMGLARGYINRPGLTAEKFIANPFSNRPGDRLYRTGDLARYLPDGNIDFIGRVDHQVKIRGFRIELGEIESTISSIDGVKQAIVLAREDDSGQKKLVAYVVPNHLSLIERETQQQNFITVIRKECSQALPDYMSPSQIMLLAEMPLTPNGKVDRKALPKPEGRDGLETYQAPEGIIENSLASIWKDLLQVERVGRGDNFFHLGGHSLIATRLISKIRQNESIEVPLRAVFEHPILSDLAHVIEQKYQSAGLLPSIKRAAVSKKEDLLLSFAQERLWFIEKYEQGTNAYNIPIISKLNHDASIERLERSIQSIIARHEILKTVIKQDNAGGYYQDVLNTEDHPFEIARVKCASEKELDANLRKDVNHVFDLSNDYPIRVRLYSLVNSSAKPTHVLSVVIHHIAFDGWSTDLFLNELKEFYRHFKAEEDGLKSELNLPSLTIQYKDFALWQREYLIGNVLEEQLAYWKGKLEGYETLHLPTDFPRPTEMDYEGDYVPFELEKELSLCLRNVAKDLGVSLYSLMLSCYYLMLRVYSGQDDIVIGSPVANRHYSQIQDLIGFFVNTLALRVNFQEGFVESTSEKASPTLTLRDFIKHVGNEVIDAQLHQDLPFEKLVEELDVPKDTSRHPIFQVMFNLHSFGNQKTGNLQSHELEEENLLSPHVGKENESIYNIAKFDLETLIDDGSSDGVLRGGFDYRTSLFHEETIKGFIRTYKEILSQVAKALSDETTKDSFKIDDLTYLTKEEESLILTYWNRQETTYPKNKTIHQFFEEQVERTPDNVALVYKSEGEDGAKESKEVFVTYKELNKRANKLANYLKHNYHISSDTLIPLLLDRSEHMIIAILAVLKAGGAYVPMSPDYPDERIKYILEDVELANSKKGIEITPVIANEIYTEKLINLKKDIGIIAVDSNKLSEKLSHELTTQPMTSTTSHDLAYIIYTSGTTGNPKGVMQLHSNVMRLFTATDKWYHFGENDVWTLFHSYVFDFTVWEIWGALLYGGKLIIPSHQVTRDLYAFYDLCEKEKVTVLNQTPSVFYQLIDIAKQKASQNLNSNKALLPDLKYIIFGGEALNLSQLKPWFDLRGYDKPKLINMYGITETTVHVTYKEIAQQDLDKGSYIGERIPDLTTYVLSPSASLTPLPIGAIGELYVGGEGLARGYLNNEKLSNERFIPNPFQTTEEKADTSSYGPRGRNSTLYKTGDLVRWLPDGSLEYIGRTDFQVKIRGYRIELGEIENALSTHGEVNQCVVLVNELDSSGVSSEVKYLIAYYTTGSGHKIDEGALSSYLSSRLPGYMVPSVFIHLDKLPLTINGKLDRKALPKPEAREVSETYQAPQGFIENSLASIWKQLLQIETVSRNDNFFHLGGNSLLLVKMFYLIKKLLNVQVSIKDIHRTDSLASLAEIISKSTAHRENNQINNIAIEINKTETKPMFLIHAIGGLALSYAPLKKVWPKQHIIGINDPYFGFESSGFSSLMDMASHYIDVIKAFLMNWIVASSGGGHLGVRLLIEWRAYWNMKVR
jgi:amino acid adenylation domain-containing protein